MIVTGSGFAQSVKSLHGGDVLPEAISRVAWIRTLTAR
jgi:hypothetical protein